MNEINKSKEMLNEFGYLQGTYVSGQGEAHNCCSQHNSIFNCKMFGTFNIKLYAEYTSILHFTPSIHTEKNNYWFVVLSLNNNEYCGWAVRGHDSHQGGRTLEILTKKLLPDDLKTGILQVQIFERWDDSKIKKWAKDKYWFQTFPFTPVPRSNSQLVWDAINVVDWKDKKVLDIGCQCGYFSFQASKSGAYVCGTDSSLSAIQMAKTIRNNIIQQDVKFEKFSGIPFSSIYDISLYLSVHHQIDPNYLNLQNTITQLKRITKEHIFVELILPPTFPKEGNLSEDDIDKIVSGTVLARYKNKVRGFRKVYWIQK